MNGSFLQVAAPALLPVGVWLAWVIVLYGLLSGVRFWQRAGRPVDAMEARLSANLSNQFEAPLLGLVALVLLLLNGPPPGHVVGALWIFVAGRFLHSAVHVLQSNVIIRGLLYMPSFLVVVYLWGVVLWRALEPLG